MYIYVTCDILNNYIIIKQSIILHIVGILNLLFQSFVSLFFHSPHLRFNNLTLISPHGLPGEMPPDELRDQMLGRSYCYDQDSYAKISLRTWVNVVVGKMTACDRKRKVVIVNGNTLVPYDHLVMCMGQQYQVPAPTEADIDMGTTNRELPNSPDRRFLKAQPKNLFTVNDEYDAAVALYWIENYFLKSNSKLCSDTYLILTPL